MPSSRDSRAQPGPSAFSATGHGAIIPSIATQGMVISNIGQMYFRSFRKNVSIVVGLTFKLCGCASELTRNSNTSDVPNVTTSAYG